MTTLPFDRNSAASSATEAVPPSPLPIAPLGRSGLALPRLGLGCAGLGELFVRVPNPEADALLAAALAAGIRYFDTAPWYGRGKSEHRVGRFLWEKPRDAVIVSTKVGRVFHRRGDPSRPIADQWLNGLPFEHRFDYGYDGIMRSFEDSLMRLGLDSVEMLVIHDLDTWHHDEAGVSAGMRDLDRSGWRALDELRRSGAVKAVGAGINLCGDTGRFLDAMPLDFFLVALRLTLLEHAEFAGRELPRLVREGVGVVVGGVFSSGLGATGATLGALFNYAPADEPILARTRAIEAIAARHGVPLAAASLQFPLRIAGVAAVIPGAVTASQVADIDRWFHHPILEGFWAELVGAGLIAVA
ncbi:MAG TPA: aldo/keto reductase [Methylomirabilota bacterium]|nr:aldo/keto reductase [Methylomirabilota bacterium]